MNPYDKIAEHLYLGSRHALDSYDKFKLIVNCTKESDVKFPPNCDYCIRLPVDDIPDESDKLLLLINTTNILNTIHKKVLNKEPVLVHCSAGRQRSCAVVACYLIRFYNMTPLEAIDYIKSNRKVAFFGAINFSNTINQFYIEQKKLL